MKWLWKFIIIINEFAPLVDLGDLCMLYETPALIVPNYMYVHVVSCVVEVECKVK